MKTSVYQVATPQLVLDEVSRMTGISVEQITGSSKKRSIVEARHIAMYVLRITFGDRSKYGYHHKLRLCDIAELFEKDGRHGSVIGAWNQVTSFMSYYDEYRVKVDSVVTTVRSWHRPRRLSRTGHHLH